ncbi:hypothetical protein BDV18DRAFT_139111 [Aspergillus unguis]
MSALGVRQLSSDSTRRIYQLVRQLLGIQILIHLFKIAISLVLLPLDNTILCLAVALSYLSPVLPYIATVRYRRGLQYRPKTILVTGINTPHGLRIARSFHDEGHRVVGADVTDAGFPAGESLSWALVAYYRITKLDYRLLLLDIVQRENVDLWIPCLRDISVIEDAMAKEEIESRTSCRCVTLDTELATQWSQSDSLIQYLVKQGLPVVENHQVQSRDIIHRILNRSPSKVYHMRKRTPASSNDVIVLPKRTLSSTYSEVSEIQVSKDSPWLMQQHGRLGEFDAELLIIRGHVSAITICPTKRESVWGRSPLNDSLAVVIYQVLDKFASRGTPRINGHFAVRLMVDEELSPHSVRYEVHIAGCAQGAGATARLLLDTPHRMLVNGYLRLLEDHTLVNGIVRPDVSIRDAYRTSGGHAISQTIPALYPGAQYIGWMLNRLSKLLFWKDWRFAVTDPLPWWWHNHIFLPLKEFVLILQAVRRALGSQS